MLNVLEVDDICEIYQDINGFWRWTSIAATGEIVGKSDWAFEDKSECIEDAKKNGFIKDQSYWLYA